MTVPIRRWLLMIGAFLVVAAVGFLDYLTGPDISFVLLYLMPVVVAAWLLGSGHAGAVGLSAGVIAFATDVALGAHGSAGVRGWNAISRLVIFFGAGVATAWLRRDRDRLNQLYTREQTARVATVEQLRHRDRLATVEQLASGIAHELGTPMNVIAGRAEFVVAADGASPEIGKHARIIIEQAERVSRTIRQLLDFARRRGPQLGPTDLLAITRRTLEMCGSIAEKKGVVLAIDTVAGAWVVQADETQIQQALTNLIVNAVRATKAGGRVRVALGGGRARSPLDAEAREGEYVFLRVEDDGAGISAEHLERIFEPFFTTHPVGDGTGLGLTITDEIVRDHGGWIDVWSALEKGSRFTIFLPAAEAIAAGAES